MSNVQTSSISSDLLLVGVHDTNGFFEREARFAGAHDLREVVHERLLELLDERFGQMQRLDVFEAVREGCREVFVEILAEVAGDGLFSIVDDGHVAGRACPEHGASSSETLCGVAHERDPFGEVSEVSHSPEAALLLASGETNADGELDLAQRSDRSDSRTDLWQDRDMAMTDTQRFVELRKQMTAIRTRSKQVTSR